MQRGIIDEISFDMPVIKFEEYHDVVREASIFKRNAVNETRVVKYQI